MYNQAERFTINNIVWTNKIVLEQPQDITNINRKEKNHNQRDVLGIHHVTAN